MTFELSPDEMKCTRFTLDTNLLIQATAVFSASFVYLDSDGFLISIGAVCSLELWESGCLLSSKGLTVEGAGFFFCFSSRVAKERWIVAG